MKNFIFNYKGKKFKVNVKICKNYFSKATGLMFRKKSKPLLFIFSKKSREPIHSFFCKPFIAIWFDEDKIVQIKHVRPWRFYIRPSKYFNKLVEIPKCSKEFEKIRLLIKK